MSYQDSSNIYFSDLTERSDGLYYQKRKKKPFSGIAKKIHNKKLIREYEIKSGEIIREISHTFDKDRVFPEDTKKGWFNYNPPDDSEKETIKNFGHYPDFDPDRGKLSKRLSLELAETKEATRIIVVYHYLHRGRTMAQLHYWILVDGIKVGVISFAYPRLSSEMNGIRPMNILELARLWISPDVQDKKYKQSAKKTHHAVSVASCAIGKALRRIQVDWYKKYFLEKGGIGGKDVDVFAVVSWADNIHHEGIVYTASNFSEEKKDSGGSYHGKRKKRDGTYDLTNHADYLNEKTMYWHLFKNKGLEGMGLSDSQKRQARIEYEKEQGRIQSEKQARKTKKTKTKEDRNLDLFESF